MMSVVLVISFIMGGTLSASAQQGQNSIVADGTSAMPMSATDETKVPHYYGPWSNYANSSFTIPDVTLEITGDGAGAAAIASVGVGGVITGITITDPGSGYTSANAVFTSATGTGAAADVTVNTSGVVTSITVDLPGAGYVKPSVVIGGGGTATATATAYGGVDQVSLSNSGSGYTFPTVDFDLPDDPNGIQAKAHAEMDLNGAITAIVVDSPGSGYASAPGVAILDGTRFNPIAHTDGTFVAATAAATLSITAVEVNTFGNGYPAPPSVTISDLAGTGNGATATSFVDLGAVTGITLTNPGSGYLTQGGIKKFKDGLPMLCDPSAGCTDNNLGQHIPIAVPDTTTFPGTDYYVIALVQHTEQMHSDLPPTLLREYVQLETTDNASWSKHVALQTALLGNASTPTLMPDGSQAYAVDDPHYLGPIIVAQKDRPVRLVFYNLLPTGSMAICSSRWIPRSWALAWAR